MGLHQRGPGRAGSVRRADRSVRPLALSRPRRPARVRRAPRADPGQGRRRRDAGGTRVAARPDPRRRLERRGPPGRRRPGVRARVDRAARRRSHLAGRPRAPLRAGLGELRRQRARLPFPAAEHHLRRRERTHRFPRPGPGPGSEPRRRGAARHDAAAGVGRKPRLAGVRAFRGAPPGRAPRRRRHRHREPPDRARSVPAPPHVRVGRRVPGAAHHGEARGARPPRRGELPRPAAGPGLAVRAGDPAPVAPGAGSARGRRVRRACPEAPRRLGRSHGPRPAGAADLPCLDMGVCPPRLRRRAGRAPARRLGPEGSVRPAGAGAARGMVRRRRHGRRRALRRDARPRPRPRRGSHRTRPRRRPGHLALGRRARGGCPASAVRRDGARPAVQPERRRSGQHLRRQRILVQPARRGAAVRLPARPRVPGHLRPRRSRSFALHPLDRPVGKRAVRALPKLRGGLARGRLHHGSDRPARHSSRTLSAAFGSFPSEPTERPGVAGRLLHRLARLAISTIRAHPVSAAPRHGARRRSDRDARRGRRPRRRDRRGLRSHATFRLRAWPGDRRLRPADRGRSGRRDSGSRHDGGLSTNEPAAGGDPPARTGEPSDR